METLGEKSKEITNNDKNGCVISKDRKILDEVEGDQGQCAQLI